MDNSCGVADFLFPGRAVQLEFSTGNGVKIVTKTTVCHLEATELILDLPQREDAFNQVAINTNVAVICKQHDEQHDYVLFTNFLKVNNTDPLTITLSKPEKISKGRAYVRYDAQIPFSYFYQDKVQKDGMVENLSLIGLLARITPNESLKMGMELPFKIEIPASKIPVLLVGRIARLINTEAKCLVALSFPHAAREIQDQIAKFLFSIQQLSRKKEQTKPTFIKIS